MDGRNLSTSQAAKETKGNENRAEPSCNSKEIECVQKPSDGQKGTSNCSDLMADEAGKEVSFEFLIL